MFLKPGILYAHQAIAIQSVEWASTKHNIKSCLQGKHLHVRDCLWRWELSSLAFDSV